MGNVQGGWGGGWFPSCSSSDVRWTSEVISLWTPDFALKLLLRRRGGGKGVDVEDCERNESHSIEPICLWFCLFKVLPVNQWLSAAYLAGSRRQTPVYEFARLICVSPSKERRKERKAERKNEGRANKPNVRSTREKDRASS